MTHTPNTDRNDVKYRFNCRHISVVTCGHQTRIGEELTRMVDGSIYCATCAP